MATKRSGLYFMFLGPPLSEVSGSATETVVHFSGGGKDQLPWKSLVTFLYEDHCLSDENVVEAMWKCYEEGSKYKAVELLMKAFTCR